MVVSQLGPHNHLISNTPEWSYCFIKKAPKNNHFFLSSWVGSILQILQSDWFWEWSVFSPSGPLTAGSTWKNVLKFSWKPFKSPLYHYANKNVLMQNFSLSFALPLFSLPSTRSYGESCCNYNPSSFRFFLQPFVRF